MFAADCGSLLPFKVGATGDCYVELRGGFNDVVVTRSISVELRPEWSHLGSRPSPLATAATDGSGQRQLQPILDHRTSVVPVVKRRSG